MQTQTATAGNRLPGEQARVRALVRFNSLMFQTLVAASFLESAVPAQAARLAQRLGPRTEVRLWIEEVWWPQRAETGRELRGYVEAVWPEFDWRAAFEDFQTARRPRDVQRDPAEEALTACVHAAQAAVLYRTLARCADEPALRELAGRAAARHAAHFDFFRALYEEARGARRHGLLAMWRAIDAACRVARDTLVPAALEPIEPNWSGPAVVSPIPYPECRERIVALVLRHARLGFAQRLLLRAWRRAPVAASRPAAVAHGGRMLGLARQPA